MTPSTTSKELSERLKALGVKQESVFGWVHTRPFVSAPVGWMLRTSGSIEEWEGDDHIAAFTAGELGEMLPVGIASIKQIVKGDTFFMCDWFDKLGDTVAYRCEGDNESEARGLMLEYLLTNGLLQADAITSTTK